MDRRRDEQIISHPNDGILFSLEKEGKSDSCYDLEDLMLSELSQSQKDNYWMIHLDEVPGRVNLIEINAEWWLPGALSPGAGDGGVVCRPDGVQFCKMKQFCRWMVAMVAQPQECS